MGLEIERKFLVKNDDFKQESYQHTTIKQGFLNSNKNRIVRIRITDTLAFITVKGKSNLSGTTRFEWEKEIRHLCYDPNNLTFRDEGSRQLVFHTGRPAISEIPGSILKPISCPLNEIITSVLVHPEAKAGVSDLVEAICERSSLNFEGRSSLYSSPRSPF